MRISSIKLHLIFFDLKNPDIESYKDALQASIIINQESDKEVQRQSKLGDFTLV